MSKSKPTPKSPLQEDIRDLVAAVRELIESIHDLIQTTIVKDAGNPQGAVTIAKGPDPVERRHNEIRGQS
jgi:hypothetical protein